MKKLLSILTIFLIFSFSCFAKENEYKMFSSKDYIGKVDINYASRDDMLKASVPKRWIDKIIELRDTKGNIENLKELENISGIGEKTRKKLEKYFVVKDVPMPNKLYINKVDDKTLRYYDFNKKEIKEIREYIKKHERIKSSIMFKEAVSKKQYNRYKDVVRFDIY